MSAESRTLVVGIGSMLGDDQAGWLVAGQLAEWVGREHVKLATVPLDLIDWLDGVETLHVIDACRSSDPIGTVHRLSWSQLRESNEVDLSEMAFGGKGTHDFDLPAVMMLAEETQRLPAHVTIWAVTGSDFELGDRVNPAVLSAVERVAVQLASETRIRAGHQTQKSALWESMPTLSESASNSSHASESNHA